MSTWGERAHCAAEALDMEAIEATDPEDVQYGFREGARWQREALLTDEAVERAAWGCFDIRDDAHDDREWGELDSQERELYLCQARAALTAAIEGEDEK